MVANSYCNIEKKGKIKSTHFLIVQHLFNIFFRKLGLYVSKYPAWFIILPVLLSGILSTGFLKMRYEDDPEYLYCHHSGKAKIWKSSVESFFPLKGMRDYDYGRETRLISGFLRVNMVVRDGGTILRPEILDEIAEIDRFIQNITVDYEGVQYDYSQLCARYFGECTINPLLHLHKNIDKILSGKMNISYPVELSADRRRVYFYGITLGNVKVDNDSHVVSASAGQLLYFLDSINKPLELIRKWETAVVDAFSQNGKVIHRSWKYLDVHWITSSSILKEFVKAGFKAMPTFQITVIIMVTFSMLTCMMQDCVKSKPWLGAMGCFSALLAVAAGCGICMWIGIPFPPSNFTVPFVLLGIGIDDTFILLSSWRNTSPSQSLTERIVDTYVHSGVAITLTSLTNIASFVACAFTPLPGLQFYGIYAAIACVLTYCFQLSLIGGCLVYMARAEIRGLHATLPGAPVYTTEGAKKKNVLIRLLFTAEEPSTTEIKGHNYNDHKVMNFFKDTYGNWLSKTPTKIAIIFVFLVYFAFGAYGSFILEDGMEINQFFPEDSFAFQFFDIDAKYFAMYPHRVQITIEKPLDYSKPEVQKMLKNVIYNYRKQIYLADNDLLTEFWLDYYLEFLNSSKDNFLLKGYNLNDKQDFIKCLRFVFFRLGQSDRFKGDIVFNKNYTEIVASRFFVQSYNTTDVGKAMVTFKTLDELTNSNPFKSTFYSPLAILCESFTLLRGIFLSTVFYTIISMLIITLIFIPNIIVALWTTFSIISIEIGVVGYMVFWGLKLNAATLFGLIMYIGLSVDNAVHITYAYVSSPEKTPNGRMKDALHKVGLPILQGCTTTILGVSALYFLPSYIFQAVFKLGFLVMIFSAFHSLALVPILLSIFSKQPMGVENTKDTPKQFYIKANTEDKNSNKNIIPPIIEEQIT
ncbi:daf-6, partial [Cordylochernes scorpioides]